MKDIYIRRPKLEDKLEILHLFKRVVYDTFEKEGIADSFDLMKEILDEKKKYLEEDFNSKGLKRYFLIAECENKIVGIIASGSASDLLLACTDESYKDAVEIGTLFILPEYQRLGIASLLLQKICKKLVRRNIHEFCIHSGYQIAGLMWQKKLGIPTIELPDYWGDGYPHRIWRNKLNESAEIITNN